MTEASSRCFMVVADLCRGINAKGSRPSEIIFPSIPLKRKFWNALSAAVVTNGASVPSTVVQLSI